MKAKTSIDSSKLSNCFRVGMAALEATCRVAEIVKIVRPAGSQSASALKSDGVQALKKAAAEARRIQKLMPAAKKAAGVVARKAEHWAKELEKPGLDISPEYLKKLQFSFNVLSGDLVHLYSDGLKACGKTVPPDKMMSYLYPEWIRKK